MEHKIGEIFEYNGEWYQCCKREFGCMKCYFNGHGVEGCGNDEVGSCTSSHRSDGKDVIFKKLEKVGEPIKFGKKLMQDYKVFIEPYIPKELEYFTIKSARDLTILIEIKQNKENMEEERDNYDGNMDKECIQICDALNSISDVHTTESCCGHCKDRFMVFFTCDNPHSLAIIARVFDRRYIGTSQPWYIELQTKDSGAYDYFIHSETKYDSEEVMMKDINQIIENIKYWCDNKFASHFKGCDDKLTLAPFDLQAAKAGKPVCTRDGRKARIVCFDYNGETGDYPIVALVSYNKGNNCYERILKYTSDGLFNKYGDYEHDDDLMMLPEKKEGWVNVYKGGLLDTKSYPTKKEAFDKACPEGYVDTVKIEWEE